MPEALPSPQQHYPFENVRSPDPSSSNHSHHTRRDKGRDAQDLCSLHVADGLGRRLSGWGFLTPECERCSHTRQCISNQGSSDLPIVSNQNGMFLGTLESAQAQRILAPSTQSGRASFTEEYGKFIRVLHYNSTSTVRLFEKKAPAPSSETMKTRQGSTFTNFRRAFMPKPLIKELYAVKVFHRTKSNSNNVPYFFRDRSQESSISHPNIISIIDILYNKQGNLCLVMPYCTGGNLHTFLQQEAKSKSDLSIEEVNCLSIQIFRAVGFLHEHGIAHGDLRPEHILLTARGTAKVGGFGEDEDAVRELAQLSHHENSKSSSSRYSSGNAPRSNSKLLLCVRRRVSGSSTPYLPPERFSSRSDSIRQGYTHQDLYDVRAGDIWACGMIYMILRSGRLPWRGAQGVNRDKSYVEYLHCRCKVDGYGPIQVLETHCRNVIYAMLHPDPSLRITATEILRSEWVLGTAVCEAGNMGL